jgi:hypothetical protein
MLEKQIEKRVCEYAKDLGYLVYKFTSPSRMAVPDRLFIGPKGVVFFVEFKRAGEKPTPAQAREHERIEAKSVNVFVVDDVVKGKLIIDLMRDRFHADSRLATPLPEESC